MDQKTPIKLPSRKECLSFWEQYATPLHVREHMRQVNRVGVTLARQLIAAGENVILPLVDRATLLHDTVRVTDWDQLSFEWFPYTPTEKEIAIWQTQRNRFPSHIPHNEVNFEVFRDEYPEMAHVILFHSIGCVNQLSTWEEKIVNYADRRVAHDRIVTIQERLDEAYERYRKTRHTALEHNPEIVSGIKRMEEEIFSRIGCDPNNLVQLLEKDMYEHQKTTKQQHNE